MDIKSLNDRQKNAVLTIGGPMLVFAGAGSGKTRVLTYKIAYLIQEIGMLPENILAVTFTNKAAQEMKSRVHDLVDVDLSGITIGTFHSIGAMILRREIGRLGWDSNFTIYDQTDSKSLVKNIIKDLNLDLKMYDPKSTLIKISIAKNSMQSFETLIRSSKNIHEEKIAQIYKEYEQSLKGNNCLDFDDLLVKPLDLFNQFPEVLAKYQNKFKYILVDEYQDTNKPQFEFIKLLSELHKDVFAVGDDDQSIYGWRGADISNILNFQNTYADSKIVKLEENYRSTQNILEAAWSVVSRNQNRADKKLWTKNDTGDKIRLIDAFNEKDEALRIIKDISEIKKNKNISYDDILILYRTNAQSRAIEDAFIKNGILYNVVGGVKFYDRKEVKDLLAYLKLINNPKDTISFDRIVNFPARGIGKTSLDKIHKKIDSSDNLIDCILGLKELGVGKKQTKSINEFCNLITFYKSRFDNESISVVVKDLIDEMKIREFYKNQNTSESEERWLNIEECITGIVEYENSSENPKLSEYLEEVSLFTDLDSINEQRDKVTMMTIHASKGLEFDYVFIAGLEKGLFPIERIFEEENLEEERRLFYVAMTRAQKKVVLSYARSRRRFGGEPIPTTKSRFIQEIPENLIDNFMGSNQNFTSNNSFNDNFNNIEFDLKIGNIVYHKIFGKGKVESIDGSGSKAKITILFFNNTRKKLIYKYANLEKIE